MGGKFRFYIHLKKKLPPLPMNVVGEFLVGDKNYYDKYFRVYVLPEIKNYLIV